MAQECIWSAAEEAFPKPSNIKKNKVIRDETFALILQRGRLRKRMRDDGRRISDMINTTLIHYILRVWATSAACATKPLVDLSYHFWHICFDLCLCSITIDFITI